MGSGGELHARSSDLEAHSCPGTKQHTHFDIAGTEERSRHPGGVASPLPSPSRSPPTARSCKITTRWHDGHDGHDTAPPFPLPTPFFAALESLQADDTQDENRSGQQALGMRTMADRHLPCMGALAIEMTGRLAFLSALSCPNGIAGETAWSYSRLKGSDFARWSNFSFLFSSGEREDLEGSQPCVVTVRLFRRGAIGSSRWAGMAIGLAVNRHETR